VFKALGVLEWAALNVIVLVFAAPRKETNSWQSIEASVIAEKFQAMVALGSRRTIATGVAR